MQELLSTLSLDERMTLSAAILWLLIPLTIWGFWEIENWKRARAERRARAARSAARALKPGA